MHSKDHWETVYTNKEADAVSWFQPHADLSIDFIKATGMGHDAAITDVGGGASTLVDDLLNAGYSDLTVLDLSTAAMNAAKNVWVSRRTGYTGSKSPGQSLPVMRYHPDELHNQFGDAFVLLKHQKETHQTPSGAMQQFVYCYCRRS